MKLEYLGTVSGSDTVKDRVEFYVDGDGWQTWFPADHETAMIWATLGGRRVKLTLELTDGAAPGQIGFVK